MTVTDKELGELRSERASLLDSRARAEREHGKQQAELALSLSDSDKALGSAQQQHDVLVQEKATLQADYARGARALDAANNDLTLRMVEVEEASARLIVVENKAMDFEKTCRSVSTQFNVCMCVCASVCEREKARESVCVCKHIRPVLGSLKLGVASRQKLTLYDNIGGKHARKGPGQGAARLVGRARLCHGQT